MNFAKRLVVFASLLLVCAASSWGQNAFLSASTASGTVGTPFSFQLQANNSPSSYTAVGLPALGLALADPVNGIISGTPTTTGSVTVALTAINNTLGIATGSLTITIVPAVPVPVITSPLSENGIVGVAFSYQIVASDATGYDAAPLPDGLTVDTTSGLISGTPVTQGAVNVVLSASNHVGTATATLALTILPSSVLATTNVIFSEGFESNFPSGWQVGDANASGTPAYWASVYATAANPFAGISAAAGDRMGYCAGVGYAGTSAHPAYQNNMAAYMQRTFDLSGSSAVTLAFRSRISGIEVGFDFCRVLVSTNGGKNWVDRWPVGVTLPEGVSRVDAGWTSEVIPLNVYAGNAAVTIRFEFDSDKSMTGIGWFLDDIELSTGQGDRFDNATVIATGTNYTGTVASKNALDVTRVTLRAGYTYVITASPGSLFDPQMWLFNSNRVQLAYNDDASGLGLASRITYNCTVAGDYFVQVGGVAGDTGSYTLLVAEQQVYADMQAVSVSMTLPDGDPRGLNPASLEYTLKNNGPFSLNNGAAYSYLVEAYLSTNRSTTTGPGTGELIGSEMIQLAMASGSSTDVVDDASLTSYTIPADLPTGVFYVWLHATPLSGSPTDAKSANNWVVGCIPVTSPPPATVTIAGIVTKSGGLSGKPGVTVTLVADDGVTTNAVVVSDSYGDYIASVSNGWSGTVTPSSDTNDVAGSFTPPFRTLTNVTANLAAQDFAWAPAVVIAGRVTRAGSVVGVPGVALALSDGQVAAVTDALGNYRVAVTNGWRGVITPSCNLAGIALPASRAYGHVGTNLTAQNFAWSAAPVVAGRITQAGTGAGMSGIHVVFSGGAGTAVTDGNGDYQLAVSNGWAGTLLPTNATGGFSPASRSYGRLKTGLAAQNFMWLPPPVISGRITRKGTGAGVAGVTLSLSRGGGTTTTDTNGNYSMTVPYGWMGMVTPSTTAGGAFSPICRLYGRLAAGRTGQTFTWLAPAVTQAQPRPAIVASAAVAAPAAAPRRLLHAAGMLRWTGGDAVQMRQSPELLTISLVDGLVKVEPLVPVRAPGDRITAVEFADGLPGIVGATDRELVGIRNVNGIAVAETSLANAVVIDTVLFLTPGDDAVLTWDLLLLQP